MEVDVLAKYIRFCKAFNESSVANSTMNPHNNIKLPLGI